MPRKQRVVDHIVERLAAIGIDPMFGADGANIEDLYDAAHFHPGITAVLAKHEFGAATMADGYSRSGSGLGVAAATSGGGALNLVAGLGEALASRVPVLALVGQTPVTFVLFNNNAHAMCVTREQLFYEDLYSYNRFRCSRLGAGLAAMFPGLTSVDGPAVVSVECATDEIPPFIPFLTSRSANTTVAEEIPIAKENRTDATASA